MSDAAVDDSEFEGAALGRGHAICGGRHIAAALSSGTHLDRKSRLGRRNVGELRLVAGVGFADRHTAEE
jgi:hypothetical protein